MIRIENLTFSYPGSVENVFEGVSFALDTAWRTGLIGRNGRGKTTLLRILKGDFEGEYIGRIVRPAYMEYFPCQVERPEDAAVDVLKEISGAKEWRIVKELALLDVSENVLERPFFTLSGGEQTKALLAAMFLREGGFLLIDEPTNHLDAQAKDAVSAYLGKQEGFLLVSHDRELLDECVDHILSLNRTDIEIQSGNFSSWRQNAEYRENFERERNDKLKKEVKRLKEAARRTAEWSDKTEQGKFGARNSGLRVDRGYVGHKAAKMMKSSKVIEKRKEQAAAQKSALLKNIEEKSALKVRSVPFYTRRLLEVKNLAVSYDGVPACSGVSFSVFQGDRIALNGKNGCGKSSVLKAIVGRVPFDGELLKPPQLKISYVAQEPEKFNGSLSDYARKHAVDETLFKAVLDKFGFDRRDFSSDLLAMSAGQRKKVELARSLCEEAHLYIWDEPLNYIDVLSRIQIEETVLAFHPTLLFVEHDGAFRRAIAASLVEI